MQTSAPLVPTCHCLQENTKYHIFTHCLFCTMIACVHIFAKDKNLSRKLDKRKVVQPKSVKLYKIISTLVKNSIQNLSSTTS